MMIDISIWQSPDIKLPVTFSFPDNTGQIGNASLLLPAGVPEQLTGNVHFQKVKQERTVEGEFTLVTAAGRQFKGKFTAVWQNQIVMCG